MTPSKWWTDGCSHCCRATGKERDSEARKGEGEGSTVDGVKAIKSNNTFPGGDHNNRRSSSNTNDCDSRRDETRRVALISWSSTRKYVAPKSGGARPGQFTASECCQSRSSYEYLRRSCEALAGQRDRQTDTRCWRRPQLMLPDYYIHTQRHTRGGDLART